MKYTHYEIDDSNIIKIYSYDEPTNTKFVGILQDVHPEGRAWNNKEEAIAWAEAFMAEQAAQVVEEITE